MATEQTGYSKYVGKFLKLRLEGDIKRFGILKEVQEDYLILTKLDRQGEFTVGIKSITLCEIEEVRPE